VNTIKSSINEIPQRGKEYNLMSAQENKAIARAFCEETWGKGNLAILPAPLDREGFKSWVADTHTGFPDLQFTITDAIAEEDKVVIRWAAQGTHKGDIKLLHLPPTGKSVSWTGIIIYRLVAGKVVEERGEENALGLLQQLGLIPTL
jgi:predicted ester cyclase